MRLLILTLFNILCHFLILKVIDCVNSNASEFYLYRHKRSVSKKLEPPSLINDYATSIKRVQDNHHLKCNAKGNPEPKITWYSNQHQTSSFSVVVESNKYILFSDGSLQVTSSATPETFYCQAENFLGAVRSRKFVVQKRDRIRDVSINYESMEVYQNEKAVIRCDTYPQLFSKEYDLKYWEIRYKNSKKPLVQLNKTEGRFSVIKGIRPLQLHIRNVSRDDFENMQVRCVLENIYAPTEVLERDIWASPKEFTYPYGNKEASNNICKGAEIRVTKGSNVELPWCSKPITSPISWYKTDFSNIMRERINVKGTKFELINGKYGNLLINNIDISDEGYYNPTGKLSSVNYHTFTVRVMVNVTVEIKPKAIFVSNEEPVKLECITTGYPIPTISWLHNGRDLNENKPLEKISNISRKSTIIFNVTIESAGVYQCLSESRDANENRMLSENQQSVPVVISKMAPKLIYQIPQLTPGQSYSNVTLKTDTTIFEIECRFNSVPKSTIVWFLDDEKIPIVSALKPRMDYLEAYTAVARLVIDLSKMDSLGDKWKYGGEYRAEVTNQYGKAYCTTLVFVAGVYKIREIQNVMWVHGEKMTLKCYVISETMPQIEWFRISEGGKIRLPASHYEKVIKGGREFIVPKLDKALHSGTYTCQSTLKTQVISKNFTITITKPPMVLDTSVDHVSFSSSSSKETLICRPKDKPDRPWYAWWEFIDPSNINESKPISPYGKTISSDLVVTYPEKLGKSENTYSNPPLLKGVPEFLKNDYDSPAQITIMSNEKLDLSRVRCVVKNHAGDINKTIPITVVNLVFEIAPPSQLPVVLGKGFALNCTAKPIHMNLKTTWLNGGDQYTSKPVNTTIESRIHQLSNGTFVVKSIKLSDSSQFMCLIKINNTNQELSKVVKITIKVPAEIVSMPDTIDLKKQSKNSLNCTVRGDVESLSIQWFRKNDNIWKDIHSTKSELKDKITRSYIEFEEVQDKDSGEYKCEAKNEHQMYPVERIIWLNVVDVPGEIREYIKNIVKHERSIDISWSPPENNGNKTITGYVVRWKLATDDNLSEEIVRITSVTIKNLRPFQSYKIEISAINSVGHGEPVKFERKTMADAPEEKVLQLQATPLSSTAVNLSWNQPDQLFINGPLKHYQVCYLDKKIDPFIWPYPNDTTTRIFDPIKHRIRKSCLAVKNTLLNISTIISELLIFTQYEFRVILVNEVGYSPAAYISIRTKEDYPEGYPTQIVCTPKENQLELEWNPPAQGFVNGVVTGYEILYFRTDKNGEPDNIVRLVSKTRHSLRNVLPNTSYTIQVRIRNSIGSGPPSESINCTTKEAAPEAPSEIRAYFIDDKCAKVTWTPPNNSNGIVRHYIMTVLKKSHKVTSVQLSATKKSNSYFSHILCELVRSESYEIEVQAVTIKEGLVNRQSIKNVAEGIWSLSRNIVAHSYKYIELECETIPSDHDVKWTRNDKEIDSHIVYKKENNGSLIIPSMTEEYEGIYKCRFGRDLVTYNVSLKSIHYVPQQPVIEFIKESANSIYLSWRSEGSPKSDDPINLFVINIYKNNDSFVKSMNISNSLRFTEISNLECGSNYKIELFAQNNYGNSSAHTIYPRTRGTKPEIPNTANLVIGNYPDSFCFNLTTFLPGQGCPANLFKLQLKPSIIRNNPLYSQHSDYKINKTVHYKELMGISCYNVTDLHPYTGYDYKIEAFNEVGSTTAEGHSMTLQTTSNTPPDVITNVPPRDTLIFYIIVPILVTVSCVIIAVLIIVMRCSRKNNKRTLRNNVINNNIKDNKPIIQSPTSVSTNRNRKLPTPPGNHVYDKGKAENPKATTNDDEDEMLVPYATYESLSKPDSNTNRERPNRSTYLTGSQAHSYQYPDMLQADTAPGPKPLYENESKQPLLISTMKHRQYDKGYSLGSQNLATLRPQNVRSNAQAAIQKPRGPAVMSVAPGPVDSEAYRPSSSLCSSTTESSTKEELREVFRHQSSNPFFSRLQETDEDGASTARGGNRSTIINRSGHMNTLSDDSIQPESYCESGSSGDDCGIRNFTQDPPGQQVIAPTSIRQTNPKSNSMSYDTAANRRPLIQQSNNFTLQQPRNQLPEEDEDESNNYTNNFVVV